MRAAVRPAVETLTRRVRRVDALLNAILVRDSSLRGRMRRHAVGRGGGSSGRAPKCVDTAVHGAHVRQSRRTTQHTDDIGRELAQSRAGLGVLINAKEAVNTISRGPSMPNGVARAQEMGGRNRVRRGNRRAIRHSNEGNTVREDTTVGGKQRVGNSEWVNHGGTCTDATSILRHRSDALWRLGCGLSAGTMKALDSVAVVLAVGRLPSVKALCGVQNLGVLMSAQEVAQVVDVLGAVLLDRAAESLALGGCPGHRSRRFITSFLTSRLDVPIVGLLEVGSKPDLGMARRRKRCEVVRLTLRGQASGTMRQRCAAMPLEWVRRCARDARPPALNLHAHPAKVASVLQASERPLLSRRTYTRMLHRGNERKLTRSSMVVS